MNVTQLQGPWSELKDWVQNDLPKIATDKDKCVLGSVTYPVGEMGYCQSRNRMSGPFGPAYIYEYEPPTTMVLMAIKIDDFNGAAQFDARAKEADQFVLPVHFSTLVVSGLYALSEPCGCYHPYFKHKRVGGDPVVRSGTFTATVNDSSLDYIVSWSEATGLSLVSASVDATPQLKLQPSGPFGDIDESMMTTFHWGPGAAGGITNVFKTAPFSITMLTELEKRIGK